MVMATSDRMTAMRETELAALPVAAGQKIPGGVMVCVNASGYAVNATAAANLVAMGMADCPADNTGGTDGAVQVVVRRGRAFAWANDPADPVNQSSVGRDCYITDNVTVSRTNGGGAKSRAGVVLAVEGLNVWVQQ